MTDWTRKLHANPEPVVRPMPKARIGLEKGDLCLLPSARLVDDFIRAIPKGKSVGILELRKRLARQCKAEGTCPVHLGYHLRTVAEAACEARDQGAKPSQVTPVWRALDDKAPTLAKLSAENAAWIRKRRIQEGL